MAETASNKTGWRRWLIYVLFGIIITGVIICYVLFAMTYSEGNRAGVLIKFSKKGYVFKTYEGELNIGGLGNVPNTAQMNQIWLFSVKDGAVADSLMNMEGKRVSLHYTQTIKTLPWKGETNSYVDGFKVLGN